MSYQFTVYPNPEFDFDLLPRFSEDHGVSYSIKNIMEDDDLNEVYVVTFSSENVDYLEFLVRPVSGVLPNQGIDDELTVDSKVYKILDVQSVNMGSTRILYKIKAIG